MRGSRRCKSTDEKYAQLGSSLTEKLGSSTSSVASLLRTSMRPMEVICELERPEEMSERLALRIFDEEESFAPCWVLSSLGQAGQAGQAGSTMN